MGLVGAADGAEAAVSRSLPTSFGIIAPAYINAFTELDVPRSSGAVSGRFRTGYAAWVLVGSVLVTCRCLLSVVRARSRSRWLGGSFWIFSAVQSATPAVGVSFWAML